MNKRLKKSILLLTLLFATIPLAWADYPGHWWKPVPIEEASSWEILPQEAKPG